MGELRLHFVDDLAVRAQHDGPGSVDETFRARTMAASPAWGTKADVRSIEMSRASRAEVTVCTQRRTGSKESTPARTEPRNGPASLLGPDPAVQRAEAVVGVPLPFGAGVSVADQQHQHRPIPSSRSLRFAG